MTKLLPRGSWHSLKKIRKSVQTSSSAGHRLNSRTEVEGVALAWTIDPSGLGYDGLVRTPPEENLSEEARHYLKLAKRSSDLSDNRITPSRFVAWAEGVGLAFHPDWHLAIQVSASQAQKAQLSNANRKRKHLITLWARSPSWSFEEGAVLAFDLDPRETIRASSGYGQSSVRAPEEVKHLLDFAYRSLAVGSIEEDPAPIEFMKWARTVGIEFQPDWWDAVPDAKALLKQRTDAPRSAEPASELTTKEQNSLLKMVAGMAMAYYGWNPDALRNPATAEIASDLERAGVGLDRDTIRKWLRTAADLLDQGP